MHLLHLHQPLSKISHALRSSIIKGVIPGRIVLERTVIPGNGENIRMLQIKKIYNGLDILFHRFTISFLS